jgi:hypothetical protein
MSAPVDLTVAVLLPSLLGTYGDRGNGPAIALRARRRGMSAEIVDCDDASSIPEGADVYLLGGGEDAAQAAASEALSGSMGFRRALGRGAPVLGVCAGFQLLGEWFLDDDGTRHDGLGVIGCTTVRAPARSIGPVVALPRSGWLRAPIIGFENHGGLTTLGSQVAPLGDVMDGKHTRSEGALIDGRVVATYLHGPVLALNPELADLLLSWVVGPLTPLEDPLIEELRQSRLVPAESGRLRSLVSHIPGRNREGVADRHGGQGHPMSTTEPSHRDDDDQDPGDGMSGHQTGDESGGQPAELIDEPQSDG